MSVPSGRNQPRCGSRSVPRSSSATSDVAMTPPQVGTPTILPRFSVLMACVKISPLLTVFWLHSTTIGLSQTGRPQ